MLRAWLLFASLSATMAAIAQSPSPVGVWRRKAIHWVHAPKDLGYRERAGNAIIFRFTADGKFMMIFASIIDQDGKESVSQGDAWTIFAGTWRQANGQLLVSYAPVYRDIERVNPLGKRIVDQPVKDELVKVERGRLKFRGDILVQDAKIERSVTATFSDFNSGSSIPGQP